MQAEPDVQVAFAVLPAGMFAETLQLPGLDAVNVCEAPLIGFHTSWMTLVWPT